MNGVSGSQKQSGSAKNMYSTVWPAGAEKSGCRKTQKEWLSTRKWGLNLYF